MEDNINTLCDECIELANRKMVDLKEDYIETINQLRNRNIHNDLKLFLLIELRKFVFYSDVTIALDPRGDKAIKSQHLSKIKLAVIKQSINQKEITDFNQFNEYLRGYIENPMKLINEKEEYMRKHSENND